MRGVIAAGRRPKRLGWHSVNPHAQRMKEDAEEAGRLQNVNRKRDESRREGNAARRVNVHLIAAAERMRVYVEGHDAELHGLRLGLDANERVGVGMMGFFGRLRWALGVAWRGTFGWQRKENIG